MCRGIGKIYIGERVECSSGGLFGKKEVENGTFEGFGDSIYFVDGGIALYVTGDTGFGDFHTLGKSATSEVALLKGGGDVELVFFHCYFVFCPATKSPGTMATW